MIEKWRLAKYILLPEEERKEMEALEESIDEIENRYAQAIEALASDVFEKFVRPWLDENHLKFRNGHGDVFIGFTEKTPAVFILANSNGSLPWCTYLEPKNSFMGKLFEIAIGNHALCLYFPWHNEDLEDISEERLYSILYPD